MVLSARAGTIPTAVVSAVVTLAASAALAGELPSPWWQQRMNAEFAAHDAVRAHGAYGVVELRGANAGPLGLRGDDLKLVRAGRGSPTFVENDPRTLGWGGIERVAVPRPATGFGILMGAALGTAAAVALASAGSGNRSDWQPVALAAGGAVVGGSVGSHGRRWHTLYPPPDDGLRVHPVSAGR